MTWFVSARYVCPAPGRDQLSDTFLGRSVLQQSYYIKYRFSQTHELGAEHSATVAETVLLPRICGSIRCSCSRVFTTSRPRPRNKLPFVGCRKCVHFCRLVLAVASSPQRFVLGRPQQMVCLLRACQCCKQHACSVSCNSVSLVLS